MIHHHILKRDPVFRTPWFDLVAKTVRADSETDSTLHYSIQTHDYVAIVAQTHHQELVLVRQFRPAVEALTIELPAGHVDPGEDPAQSAKRELFEETGFEIEQLHTMGFLLPDTGRLYNRMWCFFASGVHRVSVEQEEGVQGLLWKPEQLALGIAQGEFNHALHLAVLMLAQAHQFIPPIILPPMDAGSPYAK